MTTLTVSQFAALRPFDLEREADYQQWRHWKLASYPLQLTDLLVHIQDPQQPSTGELDAIRRACWQSNLCIYHFANPPAGVDEAKSAVKTLGAGLGLQRLDANLCADPDGIATLQVEDRGRAGEYIPYSNKPIRWHTDGYYNSPEKRIDAMLLHCVQPAAEGGANHLLDPDMLYIALRDEDPYYIEALMARDAMLIPANRENGLEIRPAQGGPVFSINAAGRLHMRYTARTRSIEWRHDPGTRKAVERISQLLAEESAFNLRYRFQAGEGVICNNVLHTRDGFTDSDQPGKGRMYLRARYLDAVAPPL